MAEAMIGKMNINTEITKQHIGLRHILKNAEKHELAFQEIFNCSAACGGSTFSKAVFRMPYFGIDECQTSDPPEPWMSTVCRMKDVFDYDILAKLLDDPNFDTNIKTNYDDLVKFIEDKNQHEVCLQKMCQSKCSDGALVVTKTDIAYALAVHLFAPLSNLQKSCILDNHSEGFPKSCPGGCGRSVAKGTTGIGAAQTWHGYADISVNQTVPVKVLSEEPHDLSVDEEQLDQSDSEDSYDSITATRTPFYQRTDPISEVLAMTITNGFAQVNENNSLTNFLIPSIACSIEDVMVFTYDSQNDLLACIPEHFRLWSRTDKHHFDISSIVRIWLYLNFRTFMRPSILESFVIEKSNFHKIAPLRHYQQYSKCGVIDFSSKDKTPRVRETQSARKRRHSDDVSR
ncbi:uncharacterized protein LOC117330468 [Pecten maximus]|uniref:uncharacterized protein LOC117330468 n=1 Tax=Pecten maximus TaxID=6579 RepID=UPI001458ED95|nr:uncharacterized protein LOC117330468 [Pecten maximus]